MTNEEQLELIAQARELLERKRKMLENDITRIPKDFRAEHPYTYDLNLVTTHLAEMDGLQEHISRLEKHPMPSLEEILEDQRHKLLTKAERLLGVE